MISLHKDLLSLFILICLV